MRNYSFLCIILAVIMLTVPLVTVNGQAKPENDTVKAEKTTQTEKQNSDEKVKVVRTASGNVETMNELDYIIGAVSAEMPPTYHEEALKAQAVACYTYLLYTKQTGESLSDNSRTHQGYMSEQECRDKWGKKYDTYRKRIVKACEAVQGEYVSFDGKPIMAAFHAICSGNTENAADIWGQDVPYLKSVVSNGDRLSPDYSSEVILTKDEFKKCCESLKDCSLPENTENYIGKITPTPQGGVKTIEIGSKAFSGEEARKAFSLRSNHFTVEQTNGNFKFSVVGYGHGVGMSQYGADYAARQGSNYKEILTHYYSGCEVIKKQ